MSDRETFWKRLDDVNAGMLGCDPDWRLVPMSHYADPDEDALWFITAEGTDLAEAVAGGAKKAVHVVSSQGGKLYARIEGELSLSDDREKLDEIWNAVASSWFEDGKQDDDVRLLRLSLNAAEVWSTDGGLGFMYQIAKSKLTGAKPDMGEHFEISFA
ncbi:pyridoxamine 5'-phosphate oxidase family protein [Paracoccus panacisoli]|uniref:Pyridoxamine 5'-phosphate oxidase family protein n=1 Tax=Paracoccus panacisoli TaxID=1510163 RepID=A0ABV6SZS9_9RHOB